MLRYSASIFTFLVIAGAVVSSSWAQTWPQSYDCDGCDSGCSQRGGHLHEASAHWDLAKKQADLIARRNQAWPKPFQCYDRQAYHCIFNSMHNRGYQIECTLTDDHFHPDSNELNSAGQAKIAGIMNNLPTALRQIHVYQANDYDQAQARMDAAQARVRELHSHLPTPAFAMTTTRPQGMQGNMVEQMHKEFLANQPRPAVPASSKSGVSGQ